jgi:hypothetical protein
MTKPAPIEDPSEDDLGPAMLALSAMQRKFVVAMVEQGGSAYRCALAAGYSDGPGIRQNAWALSHNTRVQEAIREFGLKMMGVGALTALKFCLETVDNPAVEPQHRLKAATILMDRGGMPAISEQKISVVHKDETSQELIKQITAMSKTLGVDPKKLIGGQAVEAEYEEIKMPAAENPEDDLSDIYG